jgi:hypothetical protein
MDGNDTSGEFGCAELEWRIYLIASGSNAADPSTWDNIKPMYE